MHGTYLRLSLALLVVAIGALVLACNASEPERPSPTATWDAPTSSPSPEATARVPFILGQTPSASSTADLARSRAVVDEVIAAVAAGDTNTLEAMVEFQEVPCSGKSGGGPTGPPYPGCEGAPAESRALAFAAGVCAPVWHRDPRPILERFVDRAGELYAVLEGPGVYPTFRGLEPIDGPATWDVRIVFVATPANAPLGYAIEPSEGRIRSLTLGCDSPSGSTWWWQEPAPTVVRTADGYTAPTPFPTEVPRPTTDPATVPRGDRTGDPRIDRVIDALATHNPTVIRDVIGTPPQQWTWSSGLNGPGCAEGMLEATVVDTFSWAHREGGLGIADVDELAAEFAQLDLVLYAVNAPSTTGRGGALVYNAGPSASSGRFFSLDEGAIVGTGTFGCTSPAEVAQWSPLLLRGPAWPE